jgi:hypothetical protein
VVQIYKCHKEKIKNPFSVGIAIPPLFFRTGITVLEDLRTGIPGFTEVWKIIFFVEKCPEHNLFRAKNMRYYTLLEIVKFPFTKVFKILINRFNGVILALFSNLRTKISFA